MDRLGHDAFGIIEPFFNELFDLVFAVFSTELLQTALGDARRTKCGEKIAIPLLRHADTPAAHADDIIVHLVTRLHAYAGEDDCAFLIHIARAGVIGGRD